MGVLRHYVDIVNFELVNTSGPWLPDLEWCLLGWPQNKAECGPELDTTVGPEVLELTRGGRLTTLLRREVYKGADT